MNKSIRRSIIAVFFTLGCLGVSISHAQYYGDVAQDRAERMAIDYLSQIQIFQGQGGGSRFDPDGLLNRAEWAILLTRVQEVVPNPQEYGFCFPDVISEWFAPAVCYAKQRQWVKGYAAGTEAGLYVPTNSLTVADILVTIARLQGWPVEEGEEWYSGAYEYALQSKILSEAWLPWQPVTRAQAAEILFRSLVLKKYHVSQYDGVIGELMVSSDEDDSSGDQTSTFEPTVVTLEAFAEQPASSTVARGATNVPVLRFEMSSEKKVTLDQMAIRRVSVGNTEDIAHARLLLNGKIIQEKAFWGAQEQVVWKALEQEIIPGKLALFEMSIDFVRDADPLLFYQFQVEREGLQFDQAVLIESEEIRGEEFKTSPVFAETVTIQNSTSPIKLPFIGEEKEVIGRFTITAGNHDLLIKRIRLEDAEDMNSNDFSNFRLTVGSAEVGYLAEIQDHVLDFVVNDYFIEANRSRDFTVRADIGDFARKVDNIRLYMDGPEHLYALDFEYYFGVQVINEFDRQRAWCVGSESIECPAEGLRKRCSKDDIEYNVRDCEEEEVSTTPAECDDRIAPVCGVTQEATDDTTAVTETFQNRCQAEQAGATGILPGPCE